MIHKCSQKGTEYSLPNVCPRTKLLESEIFVRLYTTMSTITLHEITRYYTILNRNVETPLTWTGPSFSVITDRGIDLYELTHNIVNYTKKFDVDISSIVCSDYIPCKTVFPNNFLIKGMSNQEYSQCLLDPNLWCHDQSLVKDLTAVLMYEWSPPDFLNNIQPAISILTNTGSIEIYKKTKLKYISIVNLTAILEKNNVINCKEKSPSDLKTLGGVCKQMLSSSLCWGGKNYMTQVFYLVTSQRNGDILFWKLKYLQDGELKADVCSKIESGHEDIVKMLWIAYDNTKLKLICALLSGKIYAYHCRILDNSIVLEETSLLWKYEDKMPAKYMQYAIIGDKTVLLLSKHRHLLVQLLDVNFNELSVDMMNINDYKIVDILRAQNSFVVGTLNCKLYSVHCEVHVNKLNISSCLINFKDSYSEFTLNGFGISTNNVLCALSLSSNNYVSKRSVQLSHVALFYLEGEHCNSISMLMNNPSEKLTHMSDCLELLKFKSNRYKTVPSIDYNQLWSEGSGSIYKLKLYLIFLILYKNRVEVSHNKTKYVFPETSVEKVRETIFMKHAVNILNDITKLQGDSGTLTDAQKEIYIGCKKYLEYYCQKYKSNIGDFFVDSLNLKTTLVTYLCQCCDEVIDGFTCKHNHLNQFCSITFTPIPDDQYLQCKSCSLLGRMDLLPTNPMCVLCDSFLIYYTY